MDIGDREKKLGGTALSGGYGRVKKGEAPDGASLIKTMQNDECLHASAQCKYIAVIIFLHFLYHVVCTAEASSCSDHT